MNTNNYSEVVKTLTSSKKVVLSTHKNPDGDTIGSALALYHFLKNQSLDPIIIGVDSAPDFLSWMPGYTDMINYDTCPNKVKKAISEADIIAHIDYNAYHRTGSVIENLFNNSLAIDLLIDHHPNPQDGFAAYVSDVSACSTAQLVYNLIVHMAGSKSITKEIATCLYVGLMTDTGSFSYGMVNELPYLMAADLVKTGIDDKWIHQQIYSNNSFNRIKLLGYALSEKLIVFEDEKWAYISLEKEELNKYHFKPGDNEGLVNYALSIQGVNAAVLLTEKDDLIRMSFRSKDEFAINQIAKSYFDGGGHKNAAGGNSYQSMSETIEKLKQVMSDFSKRFF